MHMNRKVMFYKVVGKVGKEIGDARECMATIPIDECKVLESSMDGGNIAPRQCWRSEDQTEFGNCAQAFFVRYSHRVFGNVPRKTDVVKVCCEVLPLFCDVVPRDAKRFRYRENVAQFVRENVGQRLSGNGRLAKEHKIVNPFDNGMDAVVSEYSYACVGDRALNTSCCC